MSVPSTNPSGGSGAMLWRAGAGGTVSPNDPARIVMSVPSENPSLLTSAGQALCIGPWGHFAHGSVPARYSTRSENLSPSDSATWMLMLPCSIWFPAELEALLHEDMMLTLSLSGLLPVASSARTNRCEPASNAGLAAHVPLDPSTTTSICATSSLIVRHTTAAVRSPDGGFVHPCIWPWLNLRLK